METVHTRRVTWDGQPAIMSIFLEQSEIAKNEDRSRKSDEQHQTILRMAMDGFWRTDMQGRLLEVNEAYCGMSGYSEEELLGMRIADLDRIESDQGSANRLQIIRELGKDRYETRHTRKDGSLFDVEASVQYWKQDGGQCVSYLRDISSRRQAEDELRTSKNKVKEVMETIIEAMKRIRQAGEGGSSLARRSTDFRAPIVALTADAESRPAPESMVAAGLGVSTQYLGSLVDLFFSELGGKNMADPGAATVTNAQPKIRQRLNMVRGEVMNLGYEKRGIVLDEIGQAAAAGSNTSLADRVAKSADTDLDKVPLFFGGDHPRYSDLLLAFAANYSGFPAKLAEAMKSQGTTKVHRILHDLRLAARPLGFRTIENKAGRILSRLVADAPLSRCDSSMENLAELVEAMVAARRAS